MPLAKWSHKTAVQHQNNMAGTFELGESKDITLHVLQSKVRCRKIQLYKRHRDPFRAIFDAVVLL
jgi:hypothetical protein